jgi:hypothetical protein
MHFVLLAGTGIAVAGEGSAVEPAPIMQPAPESTYLDALGETVDETHASIQQSILQQAVRLDDFFGTEKTENLRRTSYELRLRNSLRVEKGWDARYGMGVRAKFTLSKISERLRFVIVGDDQPGQPTQTLPQDPGYPGLDRTTPTAHFANTELRYEFIQKPAMNMFLGVGARLALPFEAFVRGRFQFTHHLSDVSLLHVGETIFVKNTDFLGETTEISLDRLLGKDTLLRWSSTGTASEEIRGVEWGSELSLTRELSRRNAVTLTGGAYGNTRSAGFAQNYRILARYRQNFLRNWLYYELEPEVSWPRHNDDRYPANVAVTFRLEVVFQGSADRMEQSSGVPATVAPVQDWKKEEMTK